MARTRWILGNWKQNLLRGAAQAAASAIAEGLAGRETGADVRVGLAPVYTALDVVAPACRPRGPVWLFAQDVAAQEHGAFTGEVGAAMLAEAGAVGAIVGHSERRALFGDTDDLVGAKLLSAWTGGLTVVLCVGERLDAREAQTHEDVVISQLSAALAKTPDEVCGERLVIAYEPVWAIGTGHTATPDQAQAMHAAIRAWLGGRYGSGGTDRSILYGGSVRPANARSLLAQPDVDGFLVGGASLDPQSFLAIVDATS